MTSRGLLTNWMPCSHGSFERCHFATFFVAFKENKNNKKGCCCAKQCKAEEKKPGEFTK